MKVSIDTQDPRTWPEGHSEMAVWHPGDTDDAGTALSKLDLLSLGLARRVFLTALGVAAIGLFTAGGLFVGAGG